MITPSDIQRIQDEIGRLALQAARIDVDGFLEATDAIGSPQGLIAGLEPEAVASAADWAQVARHLKPFRDDALTRLDRIRATLAETDDDLVEASQGCPACGERRVDKLTLNDDGSVVCATCGRRYRIDAAGAPEDLSGKVVAGLALSGVSSAEEVHCECADRQCGCEGSCTALATYEWGSVDDGDWQYLCYACALRLIERGTRYVGGEEVAADA